MIRRIEALNYRSLRYVSQELRPFQVLIGPNASGKSTFLDVIRFISDFVTYERVLETIRNSKHKRTWSADINELIYNQTSNQFELAAEFTIPDNLQQAFTTQEGEFRYDIVRYELSFGGEYLDVQAEKLWLISSYYNNQHTKTKNRQGNELLNSIQPPKTLIKNHKLSAGWKIILNRNLNSYAYLTSEVGEKRINLIIGIHRSALAHMDEDIDDFPVSFWFRDLLINGIHVLIPNSKTIGSPISESKEDYPNARDNLYLLNDERYNDRWLDFDGANLPLVVRRLIKDHPAAYQNWLSHVQSVLPEIEAVNTETRGALGGIYITIKYISSDKPIPSWLISDGTLRLLALTIIAYIPESNNIYLIEEPENGLHPSAIEGLYETLSSVYNGQVLITTHSPLLLGLAEPDQILCFTRDPSGATSIIRGDQHPVLRNWQGEVALSTLYASGVLG